MKKTESTKKLKPDLPCGDLTKGENTPKTL